MMRRTLFPVCVALLALMAVGCSAAEPQVLAATTTASAEPPKTEPPRTAPPATVDPRRVPIEPGWYMTATPKGKIAGYDEPGGPQTQDVTNTYYDLPTVLPVFEQDSGYLHVRLPQKPNGRTAWVKATDVDTDKTPWKIVINLAETRLRAYNAGQLVLDAPAGIGLDTTPTATGNFFIAVKQGSPNASYGPFELVTSGHSNVLLSWQGFPDGILAIHGPVGAEGMIGTTGVKLSNGCVRILIPDLVQLADVKLGSPVDIVES